MCVCVCVCACAYVCVYVCVCVLFCFGKDQSVETTVMTPSPQRVSLSPYDCGQTKRTSGTSR